MVVTRTLTGFGMFHSSWFTRVSSNFESGSSRKLHQFILNKILVQVAVEMRKVLVILSMPHAAAALNVPVHFKSLQSRAELPCVLCRVQIVENKVKTIKLSHMAESRHPPPRGSENQC